MGRSGKRGGGRRGAGGGAASVEQTRVPEVEHQEALVERRRVVTVEALACPCCGSLRHRFVYSDIQPWGRRVVRRCVQCLTEFEVRERNPLDASVPGAPDG